MSDGRVLGMLGGMAWPSTAEAYRLVNERVGAVRNRAGNFNFIAGPNS